MNRSLRWIIFSLVIASLLLSACAQAPQAPAKVAPAVLETVEGTERNRVKLTEKAAARLGIETEAVREELVSRKRTVGGTVVDASSLSITSSEVPVTGSSVKYVSARLSETDRSLLDKKQPVLIKSLDYDSTDSGIEDLLIEPFVFEDAGNSANVDGLAYFQVNGNSARFTIGQNVFVEFALTGNDGPQKIVPYSALLYDLQGENWVYTNPSPLVFIRQPVVVDYIDGNNVVLVDGPDAGTQVVTVGAPELYGIDTGVDK